MSIKEANLGLSVVSEFRTRRPFIVVAPSAVTAFAAVTSTVEEALIVSFSNSKTVVEEPPMVWVEPAKTVVPLRCDVGKIEPVLNYHYWSNLR